MVKIQSRPFVLFLGLLGNTPHFSLWTQIRLQRYKKYLRLTTLRPKKTPFFAEHFGF